MKKLMILGLWAVIGCGDPGAEWGVPDGPGFVFDSLPGEPMDAPEMAFASADELAAYWSAKGEHDDGEEIGTARQAWVSARYHGTRDLVGSRLSGTPCYKDAGSYNCMFPSLKQFKMFRDTSACPADVNQAGTDNNEVWLGAQIGIGALAPQDSSVSVVTVSTASAANLHLKCFDANDYANPALSTSLAYATNFGGSHTQISNLPENPVKAVQYDKVEIRIALDRVITSAATCLLSKRGWASSVGLHEMGHATGFGHFTQGLMAAVGPSAPCPVYNTGFPEVMKAALRHYSGSAGSASLVEDNVESEGL